MVLLQENLERETENLKNLQEAMEKDPILQLQSFRSKGVIKQSALVASILIANQVSTVLPCCKHVDAVVLLQ
jgi:hypothetical protein